MPGQISTRAISPRSPGSKARARTIPVARLNPRMRTVAARLELSPPATRFRAFASGTISAMNQPVPDDRPEDALRVSRPRAWAIRAKGYSPTLRELARPDRYLRNLRLVQTLRDEEYTMLGG